VPKLTRTQQRIDRHNGTGAAGVRRRSCGAGRTV